MRWFKVAAIAAGVFVGFLVISSIIGFLMEAAIAALIEGDAANAEGAA